MSQVSDTTDSRNTEHRKDVEDIQFQDGLVKVTPSTGPSDDSFNTVFSKDGAGKHVPRTVVEGDVRRDFYSNVFQPEDVVVRMKNFDAFDKNLAVFSTPNSMDNVGGREYVKCITQKLTEIFEEIMTTGINNVVIGSLEDKLSMNKFKIKMLSEIREDIIINWKRSKTLEDRKMLDEEIEANEAKIKEKIMECDKLKKLLDEISNEIALIAIRQVLDTESEKLNLEVGEGKRGPLKTVGDVFGSSFDEEA